MAGSRRSSGPPGPSGPTGPSDGARPPSGPPPSGGDNRHDGVPSAPVLLLSGARLADGRTVDVRLSGGRIEAVGTVGSLTAAPHRRTYPPASARPGAQQPSSNGCGSADGSFQADMPGGDGDATGHREPQSGTGDGRPRRDGAPGPEQGTPRHSRIDLNGYLLLPAPAEPHAHLDTALTAETPGPPLDSPEDVQRRVTEAALQQLGHGATALRTHVRIGDVHGLRVLEAVLQARRALRGLVDIRAVAVPRLLTGAAGVEGLAMLRDALKMGAEVVGGCPDLDPDPAGYAEAALHLAAEFGCPVDLHSHGGDPVRLSRLAAMAGGLRPGVAVGPCAGLARLPEEALGRVAGQLAAAGVTVVCLPQGGCGVLEGAGRGGLAPVRVLRAAGVRVAAGGGALRDLANPVGRADPLESAYLLASWGEADPAGAYEAVSTRAREAMGLPQVRVEAGFPAELLAVRGDCTAGALSVGYSRVVIHRGRVVSRTSAVREYTDTAALELPRQSPREGREQ